MLEEQIASAGLDPANEIPLADAPGAGDGLLDVDELVLSAFRRFLAIDTLGPDENFFECGGDSTQAMQIVHAISRGVGAQIPTDILFRYPTARQLADFLQPGHAGIECDAHASVVAFNRYREGRPVFLVPALYPSPWVFLPLVESLQVSRPIYGLRSPELDWRVDVLSLDEMVAHYVMEIRRLQPRGPYTLIGYSFGGLVAFEIANRLAVDEEVRDLILLDTAGPPTLADRLLFRPWRDAVVLRDLLAFLSRKHLIGVRTLMRVGMTSPIHRASLPFGSGPLTFEELRTALRLLDPAMPGIDDSDLEELCASLVSTLEALAPPEEWATARRFLPMYAEDPVAAVKAYKVLSKNLSISRRHRLKAVYGGAITIFADEGNRKVLQWQNHSSRPVDVRWVRARTIQGVRAHMSFLDGRNVTLYVDELKQVLDRQPA